jgi:hypothetical protein
MSLLTTEILRELATIENKIVKQESLTNDDLKVLLINLLQTEDSHENE